jgi:hypothetical protein
MARMLGATSRWAPINVVDSRRSSSSLRLAALSRSATSLSRASRLRSSPAMAGSIALSALGSIAVPRKCARKASRPASWARMRAATLVRVSSLRAASSAGAAATIRSAWRDSSSDANAAGARSSAIRATTWPSSRNAHIAAAAASTANALMPRKARRKRLRMLRVCTSSLPPGDGSIFSLSYARRIRCQIKGRPSRLGYCNRTCRTNFRTGSIPGADHRFTLPFDTPLPCASPCMRQRHLSLTLCDRHAPCSGLSTRSSRPSSLRERRGPRVFGGNWSSSSGLDVSQWGWALAAPMELGANESETMQNNVKLACRHDADASLVRKRDRVPNPTAPAAATASARFLPPPVSRRMLVGRANQEVVPCRFEPAYSLPSGS